MLNEINWIHCRMICKFTFYVWKQDIIGIFTDGECFNTSLPNNDYFPFPLNFFNNVQCYLVTKRQTHIHTPLKSLPIWGILTPGLGPAGYLGPIKGCDVIICECGGGGCECGDGWLEGCVGGDGRNVEF